MQSAWWVTHSLWLKQGSDRATHLTLGKGGLLQPVKPCLRAGWVKNVALGICHLDRDLYSLRGWELLLTQGLGLLGTSLWDRDDANGQKLSQPWHTAPRGCTVQMWQLHST